jgi:hypothetical protein
MADVATIEAIEQEISRKRNELMALEQALSVLKGDNINAIALGNLPKTREFEHLGIVEATTHLLKELGPLDTRTISDKLMDRGLRTRSKNFVATVYATLDNSPKFKRDKKSSLWELVEEK